MPAVAVNGTRLHYTERGDGAPILGDGAWDFLPDEVRRTLAHNGPAALADLEGEWPDTDAAVLATIEVPVLLVAATDSPPELRDPNAVMAAALPDARTAMVGGGHLVDPAAPEVLAFVEEVLERRPG